MSGMFEILEKIKTRPGMYIGRASVSDLFMFLVGYKTARRELGIELSEEEKEFAEHFHDWVQQRFNVRTNNSWAKIILLFTRDEKDAFECFYKLLDEFKQRDKSLDENGKKIIESYSVVNKVAEEVG
ncbi:hypothetical protein H6S82_00180 [Planktothrix sp. FACHB-1355]|uniref:Uncharacterized protein n=1 Tax=Aerosakkonema funiforme FACHB-1375 TaxID=2949571 RepID=A0A926VDS6_9CYAN|nr:MULTISPECIES: hypothetical protein [Oscillatoriales]MBD2181870.1 hypothetical protein [Aerosakkonema funiforme FACHB-1375]MBD3557290.1 hypothetical protein [Planktothrix sp. FACHB-1355]